MFVRAAPFVRDDGAWVLPHFLCNPRDGVRWTGAHDTAAVAVSEDGGQTWTTRDVPQSVGSVHMTPIDLGNGRMAAFYRRRQAHFVHRSESHDGGRTWSAPVPTDVPNHNSLIAGTCLSNDSLDGRNKELSYPALLPRPDGGLDIAYTFHRRAIKHVRLSAGALAELRRISTTEGTDA
ncbi:exo-alpha-sialidase [Roseicyclus sp.]